MDMKLGIWDRFQSKLGTPPQIFMLILLLQEYTLGHKLEYKPNVVIITSFIGDVLHNSEYKTILHHGLLYCATQRVG